MKQEEINKAAEEARRASAETLTTFGTHHYIDDVVALTDMRLSYDEVAESAFVKGVEWVLSQPLCDRLSGEEKERIKAEYEHNAEMYDLGSVVPATMGTMHKGKMELLEQIFGAELFNEK